MRASKARLANRKLDEELFLRRREQVLRKWPTGAEVNLQEAIEFHQSLPTSKRFPEKLLASKRSGRTLVQPRAGVARLEEHISLLQYLQDHGGADLLPTTIDSYTRQQRYSDAERGIAESHTHGRSMLNGFPAVNYGVGACRTIVQRLKVPVQVRHGTPDARLLAEITLAAGFTAFEGGGISYNIPYAKDVPPEASIEYWQYVDRLVGYYAAHGVVINREPFGPMTGALVAPCISHSVSILEALMAAAQGVVDITLGYGQAGNIVQDMAAILTLEELGREYLDLFGFGNVRLTTALHDWMGGFPEDEARAYGVICLGALVAGLSKPTKVIVKTPHEAMGIPTREANAAGLKATRQLLDMLREQKLPESPELELEKEAIRRETKAILNRCLELGDGDPAVGAIRALESGFLDVPFAPSRFVAGKILPARDREGAVRFLDTGNLPFPPEIVEYHRAKMEERAAAEGRRPGFQMVIDDIYAVGKGMLVGRPRG